jgi:hypothetical protein
MLVNPATLAGTLAAGCTEVGCIIAAIRAEVCIGDPGTIDLNTLCGGRGRPAGRLDRVGVGEPTRLNSRAAIAARAVARLGTARDEYA